MGGIDKKKVWTGIFFVPPVILLISLGPPDILFLMVVVATFLGLREFYTLALPALQSIQRGTVIGLGLFLSITMAYGNAAMLPPAAVILLLFLSVLFMVTSQNLLSTISSMGISLLGILYVGFLLSHISLIRTLPGGRQWVLFLIAAVWAGDISAYLSGSSLGKHKLYPKISPKKTVEGLIGAIFGSMIVALVFAWLFTPRLGKGSCILLAIGIGILGQLGDFSESMLKRSAQVKDSGTLIPGHGGMLDRLDSFLFSSPFLYYSLLYLFKEQS
jgi:phosphatidate cytidylyltransferase